jgi:hypothetical protein
MLGIASAAFSRRFLTIVTTTKKARITPANTAHHGVGKKHFHNLFFFCFSLQIFSKEFDVKVSYFYRQIVKLCEGEVRFINHHK